MFKRTSGFGGGWKRPNAHSVNKQAQQAKAYTPRTSSQQQRAQQQGSRTTKFRADDPQQQAEYEKRVQLAKKIERYLWKSTMTLVRLPGNYPLCYATGRGSHLVTSYKAWTAYKDAVNREAWRRARNEATEEDLLEKAPFTWGFRNFPSGEPFNIHATGTDEPSRAGAWVWDFVQTNIMPYNTARDKFEAGLKAQEAKKVKEEPDKEWEGVSDWIMENLASPGTGCVPGVVNMLMDLLIFPKDEKHNYTPGELSEFYNEFKAGDKHTSNLLFDQVGLQQLEERTRKLSQRLEEQRRLIEVSESEYEDIPDAGEVTRREILRAQQAPARQVVNTVADPSGESFLSESESSQQPEQAGGQQVVNVFEEEQAEQAQRAQGGPNGEEAPKKKPKPKLNSVFGKKLGSQ